MALGKRALAFLVFVLVFPRVSFSDAQATARKPPSSTAAKSSAAFDDLAKRANEAWQANHFEEAAKLYRRTVELRRAWSLGWTRLAGSLYQLGRYAEARDASRQTTILMPKSGPSWAYLGLCEYELRDYRWAFDDLTKAEKLGLGDNRDLTAQVKYRLAILWDTAGQFEMGLREILWFPQQNLGSTEILQAMGLSVLRIPSFPYELAADKQEMVLLAGQASFAANAQNMDLAHKLYEELATKYPDQPNAHFAYGQFLSHLDLDAALKEYEKEIELNPSSASARVEAAFLYLKMGQLDKALQDAQEAAKIAPQNPATHNLIGRALVELNRTSEAIPELATATRLAPQNSSFHLNLARAYQKDGQTALAAKEIATFNEIERKRALQQPSLPAPAPPQPN